MFVSNIAMLKLRLRICEGQCSTYEHDFLFTVASWLIIRTHYFSFARTSNLDISLLVLLIMAVLPESAFSNGNVSQRVDGTFGSISWIRSRLFHTHLHDNIYNQAYAGSGSINDPYIVEYFHNDSEDAMNFPKRRKWAIAILQSLSTFAVSFASSAYASGIRDIMQRFDVSNEVATLGLSLYVLGFALGPLIWAPLSEVYGRKSVYVISYAAYVAFSVAAACASNIAALLVLRFFASAFGSSSMTNTGGVIADMFSKAERGLATGLFVTAPFLGPALGRWLMSFLCPTSFIILSLCTS